MTCASPSSDLCHDWKLETVLGFYEQPFNDLVFQAHNVHRAHFTPNRIQISTLLSIKTGGCPEDCKYCPQSAHYTTPVSKEPVLEKTRILEAARAAQATGASRFCMGAAWRSLQDRDVPEICTIVRDVKALGLETCMTLGMLKAEQAVALKEAGLDYYNHNLDTSESFYSEIITTRTYQDRLNTLSHVRNAGLKTCCGGIIGMGETREDRAALLMALANLPSHPESVPINLLVTVAGTPLANQPPLDIFEYIRTIAIARILMPASVVRLSAGRTSMSDEAQAWCFFAGANSIFYGDTLLTTDNPAIAQDQRLFETLQLQAA